MGDAMRLRLGLVLAACGTGLLARSIAPAFADDNAQFMNLLAERAEQQRVVAAAQRSTVVLKNPCASAQYTLEPQVSIEMQASFDPSGRILAGAWKQTVSEKGCGASRVLNVFLYAEGPGSVATIPMLPGTTRTDMRLQHDAARYVAIAAHVPEANCGTAYVADTAFLTRESAPQPGAKDPAWQESWTIITCTHKIEVPIRFIPDATGTTVSTGPNTAIKVTPLSGNAP